MYANKNILKAQQILTREGKHTELTSLKKTMAPGPLNCDKAPWENWLAAIVSSEEP